MKKVLILCEESQTECKAWRKAGFEAYSLDVKDCSGGCPEWHIKRSFQDFIRSPLFLTCDGHFHRVEKWDLIIAHPPCTFLSSVQSPRIKQNPDRLLDCYFARDFFYSVLNWSLNHGNHIVIENPTPCKFLHLPPYSQIIHPWNFGSKYSKRTCLWIYGLPVLKKDIYKKPEDVVSFVLTRRSSTARSKSFPEITEAMVKQWSALI